jgi:CPA2 family monovalent cation:H+ antiporter-2
MHDVLVATLVLLGAALVLGAIAERLRQTAVLGYLIAGTVVGPGVLGWVSPSGSIGALAELGAATLLFSIGTEFSVQRLRALGGRAFGTGIAQICTTLAVGYALARLVGLDTKPAFILGAMLSLSSTAVVARLLVERRELDSAHGRLSMGVLLTQDLAVVPLVIAATLASGSGSAGDAARTLALTAGWAILLAAGFLILVRGVFPWFLNDRGMSRNRELVAVFAVVCAVGSALGAAAAGLSPALGAFVAGVLLGGSPFATQVRAEVAPLRTILITLFFAAVGLAGDPAWAWQNLGISLLAIAAIIVVKALLVFAIARTLRHPAGTAAAAALCLAQIGEFSFVIAEVARAGGVLSTPLHQLVVTATIGSLAVAPFLIRLAPRVATRNGSGRVLPSIGDVAPTHEPRTILIIGFGPAGQRAWSELPERRRSAALVIESNPSLVAMATSMGANVHLGNAGRPEVLEHAGVLEARVIAVTMADVDVAQHVTSLVRTLAPDARVITRSRYTATAADMGRAGAHRTIDEEALVGDRLALEIEAFLRQRADG